MNPPSRLISSPLNSNGFRSEDKHLKVLHLSSGNLYGGVETFLTSLARIRDLAAEMVPEFGLCFRGRQWDELASSGVKLHDLGPVRVSRPWTVRKARGCLRRVLAETRPEVVVIHSTWAHAIFAPEVRRAGVRLVHLAHNVMTGRGWLERWAAWTSPDLVVANSHFTADSVKNLFPKSRVEVWHFPIARPEVESSARAEVRDSFGISDETVVILQASRLERSKGLAVHFAALAALRDVPNWECWIAGGAQKAGEAKLMAELRLAALRGGIEDRVRFLGQRTDVPKLMAAADVFCQPNVGPEPFGLVFIEALYARLPVVTSGFGGAAEIVDESCGVLCAPGDVYAVSSALRTLIQSSSLRGMLGMGGPDRAAALCDPNLQLNQAASMLLR